jgi:transcriptional regulator with XRE-family HTH domain
MEETFGSRLIKLRNHLKMNKIELANVLETTSTSLGRYEKNEVQPTLEFFQKVKIQQPDINLNWFILGKGEMFVDELGSFDCPAETTDRIVAAFSIAERSGSGYHLLNNTLEEFIVRMTFSEKFTFPQSASFFSSVFAHFERLKTLRLFARAIRDAKEKIEYLAPDNARAVLTSVITEYKFTNVDKYDNLISEKQRKFLLNLVQDFEDVECFAILSDIDRAIEILEDEKLTALDRFHIPLLSSPVKL